MSTFSASESRNILALSFSSMMLLYATVCHCLVYESFEMRIVYVCLDYPSPRSIPTSPRDVSLVLPVLRV